MGTLGSERSRCNGDWMSRIIRLESEVNNWRVKFEIQSLWSKVVEDWIFDEFGFDVSRHAQRLEKDFRKGNVVDVTFSTKNQEVDFAKLRNDLNRQAETMKSKVNDKQISSNNCQEDTSPRKALKNLPPSITVTKINPSEMVTGNYEHLVGVSIEPVDDEDEENHQSNTNENTTITILPTVAEPTKTEQEDKEQVQSQREPSYEFSSIPNEEDADSTNDDIVEVDVDAADRTEFPLTIYDLEEDDDEDEAVVNADREGNGTETNSPKVEIEPRILSASGFDDSICYQTDSLEFTSVEAVSDGNDDDQDQDHDQDFEDIGDPNELNIGEMDEDDRDAEELDVDIDPGTLVSVSHDVVGVSDIIPKRAYRSRPARSLIQTIEVPGEKRKFQCLACRRIFSDRGNGHRHVRRMHPGQSVNAIRQHQSIGRRSSPFESVSVDGFLQSLSSDNDPPIPVLIPEVSLGESPSPKSSRKATTAHSSFSDTSFPNLSRVEKDNDCNSNSNSDSLSQLQQRLEMDLNVRVPSGTDIQAVDEDGIDAGEYEDGGVPVEDEDDEDDNEFEDEDESYPNGDNENGNSQGAVPISIVVPGQFGPDQQDPKNNGRLTMEQRREAAKLIRKVNNNQFKCIQCSRFFSVSCNARRHARVVHFGERLYECRICHKQFSSKTDGVIHEKFCLDKQGAIIAMNQQEISPVATPSLSTCSPGKPRPRPRRRPSEAMGVRDKTHLPIRRLRRTYGKNGRIVHVPPNVLNTGLISKKVNGSTTYYECKVCRNRYADVRSAWSHAKRMHLTEKPHKCTNCPKSYFNRKDFLKHQLKCGPVEPNEEERDYEATMGLGSNIVQMMEVDPHSLSGSGSYEDQDEGSPDLGHFLEISEVNDDANDDEVANAS